MGGLQRGPSSARNRSRVSGLLESRLAAMRDKGSRTEDTGATCLIPGRTRARLAGVAVPTVTHT